MRIPSFWMDVRFPASWTLVWMQLNIFLVLDMPNMRSTYRARSLPAINLFGQSPQPNAPSPLEITNQTQQHKSTSKNKQLISLLSSHGVSQHGVPDKPRKRLEDRSNTGSCHRSLLHSLSNNEQIPLEQDIPSRPQRLDSPNAPTIHITREEKCQ